MGRGRGGRGWRVGKVLMDPIYMGVAGAIIFFIVLCLALMEDFEP